MSSECVTFDDYKYGRQLSYDQNFKAPLWRKRSCTDIPCLLLFIVFLIAWVFIAQYAWRNGDLNKLMVPTDSFNQKCGIDSGVLNKKYLFYFNLDRCIDPLVPITGCPTPQVCVEECPQQTFIWDTMKNQLTFTDLKSRLICLHEQDKVNIRSKEDIEKAIQEERCARWYIKSAPFLNRCIWNFSPTVCEYIPPFLLKRSNRDTKPMSSSLLDVINEREMQALALTMFPESQVSLSKLNVDNKVHFKIDPKLEEEPSVKQCHLQTELGEAVIKEKMMQTDTPLSKFIRNVITHFTNGKVEAEKVSAYIVEDITNSWHVITVVILCTMIVSLIFIGLMRWLATPFLWTSIFGVLLGLVVAIFYSVKQYKEKTGVPLHGLNLNATLTNVFRDERFWLYFSIFLCIVFVILLLILIVLRKRISIALALIKEGSKAVCMVKSTVFFPIFTWTLFLLVILYAAAVGLYLGSIGEYSFRMVNQKSEDNVVPSFNDCKCEGPAINYVIGDSCDPEIFEKYCYSNVNIWQKQPCSKTTCSFEKVQHSKMITWFIVYNVFGFLWLMFFVDGFSDMVLAATFATWYWTFKKKDVPFFTLTKAVYQTLFYHMGTLAFGSLILAISRLIRLILEYIDRKLKKFDNAVTRAILGCMKCFFWVLETFLRFLSKNAYIMCAIHGKNFCSSARDAFNLTMRNFLRVITLDKVTDYLFFMCKLLLTAAAGSATYFFLANNPELLQLHYIEVPVTLVSVIAFLITTVFFSVYSMAVDTLFLCFLEDIERNDGTPERPYYMSKQLMKILGKRNKQSTSHF